jgi:transglutaminase-like putative cysteine protease
MAIYQQKDMKFKVGCFLRYQVNAPTTMVFSFRALGTGSQRLTREGLSVSPNLANELLTPVFGQTCFDRFLLTESGELTLRYSTQVETRPQVLPLAELRELSAGAFDATILPFLFPSRYCQSDLLARLAWQNFGKFTDPFEQVCAVTRWIHDHIEYQSSRTTNMTSAYDTVAQLSGGCHDLAHVGIAFCRALNLPARYLSAYAYQLPLPDFHACFEVYLEGCWLVFDPTYLAPLNGLVKIGTGRDAADVALGTSFGRSTLLEAKVSCVLEENAFSPISSETMEMAVCLDGGN